LTCVYPVRPLPGAVHSSPWEGARADAIRACPLAGRTSTRGPKACRSWSGVQTSRILAGIRTLGSAGARQYGREGNPDPGCRPAFRDPAGAGNRRHACALGLPGRHPNSACAPATTGSGPIRGSRLAFGTKREQKTRLVNDSGLDLFRHPRNPHDRSRLLESFRNRPRSHPRSRS
jgi:hypothetical protein